MATGWMPTVFVANQDGELIKRIDTWWYNFTDKRIYHETSFHTNVVAKVEGNVVTTLSGSKYFLHELDPRVKKVIEFIQANTLDCPWFDDSQPLRPETMQLLKYAVDVVYGANASQAATTLVGIALLWTQRRSSRVDTMDGFVLNDPPAEIELPLLPLLRAKARFETGVPNLLEVARIIGATCGFRLHIDVKMYVRGHGPQDYIRYANSRDDVNFEATMTLKELLTRINTEFPDCPLLTETLLGKRESYKAGSYGMLTLWESAERIFSFELRNLQYHSTPCPLEDKLDMTLAELGFVSGTVIIEIRY